MSRTPKLRKARIAQRAGDRCEYCRLPQIASAKLFHCEHVIPRVHGGDDSDDNLALSCTRCNEAKGTNLAGLDPETGQLTRLFHPRRDRWRDHLATHGTQLVGLTAVGRTTIRVLRINCREQLALRDALAKLGQWPPKGEA